MTASINAKQHELDRKRGALLGLAIGTLLDAQHAPASTARSDAARALPSDAELTCLLVDSLSANASFDLHDVAGRYLEWVRTSRTGTESWAALDRLAEVGGDPLQSSRALWEQTGRRHAGCGALARTAPIGIWFARQPEARRLASLRDCAITHFDLRCQLACVALNTAIAEALVVGRDSQAITEAMDIEIELAGELLAAVYTDLSDDAHRLSATLANDIARARRPDQTIDRPTFPIGDRCPARRALEISVWELLHAPSFEIGMLDALYRARNAAGTGAVAGALLGAYFGEEAIPLEWRERVLAVSTAPRLELQAQRCAPEHLLRLLLPTARPDNDSRPPLAAAARRR